MSYNAKPSGYYFYVKMEILIDFHICISVKKTLWPVFMDGVQLPLRRDTLLFTTKFPEIPGTHFIDLGRMKG